MVTILDERILTHRTRLVNRRGYQPTNAVSVILFGIV